MSDLLNIRVLAFIQALIWIYLLFWVYKHNKFNSNQKSILIGIVIFTFVIGTLVLLQVIDLSNL